MLNRRTLLRGLAAATLAPFTVLKSVASPKFVRYNWIAACPPAALPAALRPGMVVPSPVVAEMSVMLRQVYAADIAASLSDRMNTLAAQYQQDATAAIWRNAMGLPSPRPARPAPWYDQLRRAPRGDGVCH